MGFGGLGLEREGSVGGEGERQMVMAGFSWGACVRGFSVFCHDHS